MPNKNPAKTKSAPSLLTSYGRLLGTVLVLIVIVIAAVLAKTDDKPKTTADSTACGVYRDDRRVVINGHQFKTEVASSPAEFDKGLGGRPCILDNQAMLFAFKEPGQYAFWMKDMRFPIDIIWISPAQKVAAIEIDEQPSTYPDKFENQPSRPAQYVLEVKANLTRQLGIGFDTPVSF